MTEDVYKSSFSVIQHEKEIRSRGQRQIYNLSELQQVKQDTGLDGKGSVIDLILKS